MGAGGVEVWMGVGGRGEEGGREGGLIRPNLLVMRFFISAIISFPSLSPAQYRSFLSFS